MLNLLRKYSRIDGLFALCVLAPVAVAIVYFGLLASDAYVSESRFVVRSPEKPTQTGLGMILQTAGISNASEELFAAKAYVESRDGLNAVNHNGAFRKTFENPRISIVDRFNSFGWNGSFEDLYRYYLKHVTIQQDTTTSISTLTVNAYTPQDALRINRQLLEMAEATVNRINLRARDDLIRYSKAEVAQAQIKARAAALALAAYRTREGVIDPAVQSTSQLQMISKLQDQLIATRTELRQLQAFTPANPRIPILSQNVDDLQQEISGQMGRIAGGSRSLANSAVEYERLQLENQFADKQLASALASLEQASNEARRKQVYVERVVEPNLPDAPTEPRRLRGILATLLLGLVVWGIASMMIAGVREHGN